ncbi:hypothetical protein O6H91_04G057000 [Diphasiastrum complanatum]|uniref:Uncharacterized protein n=1 Tax=Diphasiastrum complanatum TaxID=34168 RepID=A0ACC2DXG4_DIPCM|nr:hypothetical protein O6H91_04G057000 [Diphasiastrum complanatum]
MSSPTKTLSCQPPPIPPVEQESEGSDSVVEPKLSVEDSPPVEPSLDESDQFSWDADKQNCVSDDHIVVQYSTHGSLNTSVENGKAGGTSYPTVNSCPRVGSSSCLSPSDEQHYECDFGNSNYTTTLSPESSCPRSQPSELSNWKVGLAFDQQQHSLEAENHPIASESTSQMNMEVASVSSQAAASLAASNEDLISPIECKPTYEQPPHLSSMEDNVVQTRLSQSSYMLPSLIVSDFTPARLPETTSQRQDFGSNSYSALPPDKCPPNSIVPFRVQSKYRAYTRSSSDGEDIRWYFCKSFLGPNEVAASIPTTELVGKGEYLRFSVRDSSSLEAVFLEREEELVSAWWKEYAESSRGPFRALGHRSNTSSVSDKISMKADDKLAENQAATGSVTQHSGKSHPSYGGSILEYDNEEIVGVPVKGGLYEVDLLQRRCYPVYWSGDNRRVLRGHWFARKGALDWLPLREDIAEQLEIAYRSQVWHRRTFQPSGQYAARVDLQSATPGLHALFTGEDDTWEASLRADAYGLTYVLGLQGSGIKLRRGFAPSGSPQPTRDELRQRKEEEMDDYCSQVPVRHLVFMVHGIGQRLEKANLVDDVGTFRRTVASLAEEHLTSYQRNTQRVLYIPCQWRRHLKLGGESAVENCTLEGVRALRQMISATVHDVLYYMSPVYCQDIIDSVSFSLNKLYQKFVKRNPGYDGKVSIYGHSLGSVLSYDILCHQEKLPSPHGLQGSNFMEDDLFEEEQEESLPQTPSSKISNANHVSELEALRAKVASLQAKLLSLEGLQVRNDNNTESVDACESAETEDAQFLKCSSHKDGLQQGNANGRIGETGNTKSCESESAYGQIRDDIGSSFSRNTASDPPPTESLKTISSKKHHTPRIRYTKLQFKVDTFFAVGSPLGLFLGLRNVRLATGDGAEYWKDEGIEEEMPACRQMLNIFHPYDPVAYRVEPLVCKEYIGKPPVFIPYHKGGKRLHIGLQEFSKGLTARSKALGNSFTRMVKAFYSNSSNKGKDVENADEAQNKKTTYGSLVIQRLTGSLDGRIDYMLQDSTFEHQYISALSSHTSYWQDNDTALFILKHLYRDIPDSPLVSTTDLTLAAKNVTSVSVGIREADTDLAFNFFSKDEFVAALSSVERTS